MYDVASLPTRDRGHTLHSAAHPHLSVLILDSLVSHGTLGMQSRRLAKALLIDCVRLRSFLLLPVFRGPPQGPPTEEAAATTEDELEDEDAGADDDAKRPKGGLASRSSAEGGGGLYEAEPRKYISEAVGEEDGGGTCAASAMVGDAAAPAGECTPYAA